MCAALLATLQPSWRVREAGPIAKGRQHGSHCGAEMGVARLNLEGKGLVEHFLSVFWFHPVRAVGVARQGPGCHSWAPTLECPFGSSQARLW